VILVFLGGVFSSNSVCGIAAIFLCYRNSDFWLLPSGVTSFSKSDCQLFCTPAIWMCYRK